MIRGLLLCFACFEILGLSWGGYEKPKFPVCGGMPPGETYWDLSQIGVQTIDKPIATSSAIKCLNLAGNRITDIASTAFDGLPELQYLNLSGNPITNITVASIPKLKTLILDEIKPNYNHWVQSYGDIAMMWSLPELEKLSMRFNRDGYGTSMIGLNEPVFQAPKLTHVYLTGTHINVMDLIHNLSKINNLTHLYLDNTNIYQLNEFWAQKLQRLSIDDNDISSLGDSYSFRRMYKLEYLSIASNRIEHIASNTFDDLRQLRFLNLANNRIDAIPSNSLDNLINVKNFTLDRNQLTNVPEVCGLKELRYFSLNENQIISIDQTSFCNLPHLTTIRLRRNRIVNVGDETFGHLPALLQLDLSENNIVTLPEYWLSPRNFIKELNLECNKFGNVESMSLGYVDGLESLNIGNNPIEKIAVFSLINLPNVTMIDTRWRADGNLPMCYSNRFD